MTRERSISRVARLRCFRIGSTRGGGRRLTRSEHSRIFVWVGVDAAYSLPATARQLGTGIRPASVSWSDKPTDRRPRSMARYLAWAPRCRIALPGSEHAQGRRPGCSVTGFSERWSRSRLKARSSERKVRPTLVATSAGGGLGHRFTTRNESMRLEAQKKLGYYPAAPEAIAGVLQAPAGVPAEPGQAARTGQHPRPVCRRGRGDRPDPRRPGPRPRADVRGRAGQGPLGQDPRANPGGPCHRPGELSRMPDRGTLFRSGLRQPALRPRTRRRPA